METMEQQYLTTQAHPGAGVASVVRVQGGVAAVSFEYENPGRRVAVNTALSVDYGAQEERIFATMYQGGWDTRSAEALVTPANRVSLSGAGAAEVDLQGGWDTRSAVQVGEDVHRALDAVVQPLTPIDTRRIRLSDIVNVGVNVSGMNAFYSGYMRDYLIQGARPDQNTFLAAHLPLKPVEAPSKVALERVSYEEMVLDERAELAAAAEDLLGYTPLRDATGAPDRLRRALAALEIDVLTEASVDTYKATMVEHYRSYNKMADPTWRLTALADYALPVPEYVLRKAVALKRALPEARFYVDQLAVDPFLIVCVGAEDDDPADSWTNVASRNLDSETHAYIEVWDEPKWEDA